MYPRTRAVIYNINVRYLDHGKGSSLLSRILRKRSNAKKTVPGADSTLNNSAPELYEIDTSLRRIRFILEFSLFLLLTSTSHN